ncbi:MAG TPA: universal stress protein [Acidimicrobiales bacterium]|nr:universal stress protein [Acidimicrobiales bacterium]
MTIVVGVDGSPESGRALEWAAAEAERRGTDLSVLHAWYPTLGTDEADAEQLLREHVAQARSLAPKVPTTGRLVMSAAAADALIDASDGAELVVVGSRAHFALASLLLGSVASACVRRCHCPVVVVPCAVQNLRVAS